jgi:hypothetical protein
MKPRWAMRIGAVNRQELLKKIGGCRWIVLKKSLFLKYSFNKKIDINLTVCQGTW